MTPYSSDSSYAAGHHCVALDSRGALLVWGDNDQLQLGSADLVSPVRSLHVLDSLVLFGSIGAQPT